MTKCYIVIVAMYYKLGTETDILFASSSLDKAMYFFNNTNFPDPDVETDLYIEEHDGEENKTLGSKSFQTE